MDEPRTRSSVQVLERTMRLLDALADRAEPASLKQLAAETKLPAPTAHRILAVMVEHGLADRTDAGHYRLGIRLLQLGHLVKLRLNVRQEALPHMAKLHRELHETVNLSVREGDEAVYVERMFSDRSAMRVVHRIGARVPVHAAAVGKVFLADDSPEAVQAYAARTGLPAQTRKTLNTLPRLTKDLERTRRNGFSLDHDEAEQGVSCIAAGIRDDEGHLVASISLSAPSNRLDLAWAVKVKAAADAIAHAIGFRPPSRRHG